MNKISITDQLKNTMIKGAVIGATLALIIPRKREEFEYTFIIDDMEEAKKIISSIETVSDETTHQYLRGQIDEETFALKIDSIIFNISDGVLENKDDFKLYCDAYGKLCSDSTK